MENQFVSDRLNRISESQTLEMTEKSRDLRSKGFDVIDLSVGQPDFPSPPHVKEAAKAAIDNNFTFYSPVSGFLDLREAIAKKFKRENNLDFSTDQIVVSNGAKQSLANVILSLVNHGDEILVPAPYWVSYKEIDNLANGKNVFITTTLENGFKVTPQQIEDAITPKTRVLLYSSPCNPSGIVYSRDELKAIAEVIARHPGIYIISDEIYEHIVYDGTHESIAQFDFIKDRVIVINGVSKAYSMTGWRIGYIGAPKWIADSCKKLQGQYTSGACSVSQKAAYAALVTDHSYTDQMKVAFRRRRDLALKLLAEIPGVKYCVPEGAFYIFPDVSVYFGKSDGKKTISNAQDLCLYLLEEYYVSAVSGAAFGTPECIRISYALQDEKLIEGLRRIKEALKKFK